MHSVVERDEIEAALGAAVRRFDGPSPVTEQIRHHLAAPLGGGRMPRVHLHLAVTTAAAEGGAPGSALEVGAAVEILENYALVHREIAVGDRERGGRPTVWERYGLAHGINAGDALCALAYLELLSGSERRPPERTLLMTHVLQQANSAMCAGQGADLAFDRADRVSVADYLTMIEAKTGALFGAACQLGALDAGASPARAAAYARLGRTYGAAVQMHVDQMQRSCRRWTYPAVAAAHAGAPDVATAIQTYVKRSDALAAETDIDRGGHVRALFAQILATV